MSDTQLAERSAQDTGLSIFDSGQFETLLLWSDKLAHSPILPESLRGERKGGSFKPFQPEQIASNCFRVVEQAQRWGISPFAAADCASVIYGRLMWEGKIVHSAIENLAGVRLNYTYEGTGQSRKVIVSGKFKDESEPRTVEGTVKDWKTDQWKESAYDQRLAYRGAREWARRHAPGAILGVYTTDEAEDFRDERNVTPDKGLVRETPIDPFTKPEALPEPEPEQPKAEEPEQPADNANKGKVTITDVTEASGETNGKAWKLFKVAIKTPKTKLIANTFSETLGALAVDLKGKEALAEIEKTGKGWNLVSLEEVKEEGGAE